MRWRKTTLFIAKVLASAALLVAVTAKVASGTPVLVTDSEAVRRYGSALVIGVECWIGMGIWFSSRGRLFPVLFVCAMLAAALLHVVSILRGHGAAICHCFGDVFVLSHSASLVRAAVLLACGLAILALTPPRAIDPT